MRYILLALLISCSACASKVQWATVEPKATLAVAHFVHPQNDWELMAGVLPEDASNISQETLTALDEQLSATVEKLLGCTRATTCVRLVSTASRKNSDGFTPAELAFAR